jgi:D-methionine transport system permease protein
MLKMLATGLYETLYMTLLSTIFSYLIGLPIGCMLFATRKNGVKKNLVFNKLLNVSVNFCRSIPFLILLIAVIPLTRLLVGTTLGPTATIVPLVIAAAPFVARLVEGSFLETDAGVAELAKSCGLSSLKTMVTVILPEAVPSLIFGATTAANTILSYSAMAGIVGGGGLGTIAINYGYYRYQNNIMFACVLILVITVAIFQAVGSLLARLVNKKI